ncbi:MAG: hypothetical protein ACRBBM_00550 [Pseudomonadaceae bacterium]
MDKEINASQAFDCMYYLFRQFPWLAQQEPKMEAAAEHEAVTFLLQLAQGQHTSWGELPAVVRGTVVGLTMDFMIKLQDPQSALSRATWVVDAGSEPWQKALAVIAHEIQRSFPPH